MKRNLLAVVIVLASVNFTQAKGLLIPEDRKLPPLAMLNHKVSVAVDDQVAITRVEQTFRNHTSRQLEATYVFPVPKGASVREFSMWVNGKKVSGELLEAAKAKKIYTDIVRRTQDPGLLEYIGQDLLSLKVFPILPNSDQKVEMSFTSICRQDDDLIEYTYPLKTDGKATATLEEFSLKLSLKSQHPIVNVYSPTHAIAIRRVNDREAVVEFEKQQALLDRDFQVFYTTTGKDIGLTAVLHRPVSAEDGHFLLLISPRAELAKDQQVPRDLVFVLDTSGSMLEGGRLDQAKKALKFCLDRLSTRDRFALINFATTVNRYRDSLTPVTSEQIADACRWVDNLRATGGTAINAALVSALEMRSNDPSRIFNVVFFTDGKPTIGETNTDKILANVMKSNTASTRIFTFGVGHDLNAAFLDQLADQSKAVSTYVRPDEMIDTRVASFYDKISHPVLANLKLTVGDSVRLAEVYPPVLPDLFHGDQLVVLGRYQGSGHVAVKLAGTVGKEAKEFVYEMNFHPKTEAKPFVEDLWARRKVGYLLDQIRLNGEKKELVDEVIALARRYGITTPYTSFLIVPDAPIPVAGRAAGAALPVPTTTAAVPPALHKGEGKAPTNVADFARNIQQERGQLALNRGGWTDAQIKQGQAQNLFGGAAGALPGGKAGEEALKKVLEQAKTDKAANDRALANLRNGQYRMNHVDQQGVDLACYTNNLKAQTRLQQTALKRAYNRNCMEIGGVWIDEDYTAKTPMVAVKAQSDAYFRILERRPEMREVFQLGNHLVWMAPNGAALVVDTSDGRDQMTDAEIDALFVPNRQP